MTSALTRSLPKSRTKHYNPFTQGLNLPSTRLPPPPRLPASPSKPPHATPRHATPSHTLPSNKLRRTGPRDVAGRLPKKWTPFALSLSQRRRRRDPPKDAITTSPTTPLSPPQIKPTTTPRFLHPRPRRPRLLQGQSSSQGRLTDGAKGRREWESEERRWKDSFPVFTSRLVPVEDCKC
ncbi:hypothetical protein O3P69_012223 [Scylla paramamosain]|uniref:Uncharacterized protein n=1 Tax=Scylla paramamosain TaxID=85552 RepID=A0AAW0TF99_SCYPA